MCITVSQHTHTTYTSLLHQQPLQQRAPALHRDLDSREILFVHSGVTITTPGPHLWQIKIVLNVRTTHPSPSLNKATIKSWNFFVFLLFSCANPGRCADCKADFQSLQALTSAGWSHRDDDVEIESVVGLAEAQDEEQAEQTRPWQAPVEPGELCKAEQRPSLSYQTCSGFKVTKTWTDGRFEGNCCVLTKSWQLPVNRSMANLVCEPSPWTPPVTDIYNQCLQLMKILLIQPANEENGAKK